ncbi:MAG TPA: aminotransferase class V-fold PLP-dependent enzyme [Thermoanaerobaculia bacterium]|nr:aminotransferase class V-fold PLP-dependent enzyme [Thermoanaerobaculia bacterium]
MEAIGESRHADPSNLSLGSEAEFLALWPEYESTRALDRLRAAELRRLDRLQHVYLDYTGGGLYSESQIRRHAELLLGGVFGNPHSSNPSASATSEQVEACRRRVFSFFRASPEEYEVIFTANASHALKLVGESYPFSAGDQLLLTFDNHNSVNGLREFDRVRGAHTTYIPVIPPEMRVEEQRLDRFFDLARPGGHNLFAYPPQSNFSGVQHPLTWIERAQAKGWDVLLDAAAFVPTNRLDLSHWHPDFVALSFYKMFGYPTGVGALIARKTALAKLHRPWFAGGTIAVASVQADRFTPAPGAAAFEDGTPNYLALPAVEMGLDLLDSVGIETIHQRVRCLTGWLLERLQSMRHGNGVPLFALYGPKTAEMRGGTLALNFRDAQGHLVDHLRVEKRANRWRISLRTGCFCNPGAGELALGLTRDELVPCFRHAKGSMTYEDFRNCIHHEGTGAVRISLGLASNFADVETFIRFAEDFLED